MPKQTAQTSAAGGKSVKGLSPMDWGDKCFLCGHTIGEGDPIGFYQGRNSNARCHRGCINTMEMRGGTPKDFHEFMEAKRQAPTHDKPVHQDVITHRAEVASAPAEWVGPRSIQFDGFTQLQAFIVDRGAIPTHVRVAIGAYVLQAGGG